MLRISNIKKMFTAFQRLFKTTETTLQMSKNLVINLCIPDVAVCPVAAFPIIGLCQLQELNSINAGLNIDTRLPALRDRANFLSCSVTLLDLALLLNYD